MMASGSPTTIRSESSSAFTRRTPPGRPTAPGLGCRSPAGSSSSITARSVSGTIPVPGAPSPSAFRSLTDSLPLAGEGRVGAYVVLIGHFYGGVMYDIAAEHAPAIGATIVLVVSLWLALRAVSTLARRRVRWALTLVEIYGATSGITKLAGNLMLVSGVIHLALIPSHEGITGMLFVIDGLGFILLGAAAFVTSWWRRPAVLWLLATIVAYVIWIIAGWETPDQIGIACKLIELVAL